LPNRAVLQSELEQSTNADRSNSFALLMLDIDNFKLVNDAFGHDAGDALLCAFAERLQKAVPRQNLVARLGGDEFAIILDAHSSDEVAAVADKIFAELGHPFVHNGRVLECKASIGASFFPRDGVGRSELMKAADIALYCAKAAGRGQLKVFHQSMRNDVQSRNSMIFLARRALASDDVVPYYQPKVRIRTGDIVGFEALLRWRDAGGRLRTPEKLHAAFEDPLLSAALSDRMIEKTLYDIRNWLDQGVEFGHVAINAAAAAFRSGRLADELLERLQQKGIPTRCLQIEVTETVFLGRGAGHVKHALRRLSAEGVRIALDDFGTGYASLAHLMQFPVDALKIDKSFISGLGRKIDEADAITKAIVNLGQTLGIEIVAEGIETQEQAIHLIGLGCQVGQGYFYSKAIPAEMLAASLSATMAKSA
jgi:diguanylate cyclase (GGDEF)-like protein